MGCSQSKIENEEAVSRCKDRKYFMKQAVSSRNAFAAVHSAYATYLKSTGAALSDYAQGEVLNPLFPPSSSPAAPIAAAAPPNSFDIRPPPPPPSLGPQGNALKHASSMPEKVMREEIKHVETIVEEEEGEVENEGSLRMRRRRGSRNGRIENKVVEEEELTQKQKQKQEVHHPEQNSYAFEYFFPSVENVPGTSLKDPEEVEERKEEDIKRKVFDEKTRRGVDDNDGVVRRENDDDDDDEPVRPMPDEEEGELPPPPPAAVVATSENALKKVKQTPNSVVEGKRNGKQSVNLMQVITELDDHFLKASESAHEVSKMLEATRLHYHSNFADNRGDEGST